MFYVMNNDELAIFNDSKEIIETTLKFMPQLKGQYIIETDIITASELEAHPNKVVVGDVEIEIDVPDIDEDSYQTNTNEGHLIDNDETTASKTIPTHKETITVKGLLLNPNFNLEEADKRETAFNKAFFNTSLGYIKRQVTMKDGTKKDFLADMLLQIKAGLDLNQEVKVITYDKPSFDEDIEDWKPYQHVKNATMEFVLECLNQTNADFNGI